MRRIFRQIFEDIKKGENIDLFATVALVIIISALDALDIASADNVSSVMLATLGLLAIGLLITRYKMDSIHQTHDVANTVKLSLKPFASLESELENEKNKDIWMLGLVLRGTLHSHLFHFRKAVRNGAKMRVLLADFNKINVATVVKSLAREVTQEHLRGSFDESLEKLKKIHKHATNSHDIQLKLFDSVPSISLYIFPKTEDGGVIYVEMYCYKSSEGSIPKFRVTEHENPVWYKHFVSQFELMWQDAEEYNFGLKG